jgi:hypothetical protein
MSAPCSLVVGFDFGTSFSKVVIRNLLTDAAEAIRFPLPNGDAETVLLPTLFSISNGQLFPVFGNAGSGYVPYLKMLAKAIFRDDGASPLVPESIRCLAMDRDRDKVVIDLLTWYFAHVLAAVEKALPGTDVVAAQAWNDSRKGEYVGVQLCIPVGDMQDVRLVTAMKEALHLAYVLRGSVDPDMREPLAVKSWFEFCDVARSRVAEYDMDNVCFTYPEVSAGIQSVLQSSNARDGLYISMDVGAGTVDLNVFWRRTAIRHRPLTYLSCRVVSLGVQRLTSHGMVDPYAALCLPGWHGGTFPLAMLGPEQLAAELRTAVLQLIEQGRRKQPNFGDVWGLRTWDRPNVYMWGGGAAVALYGDVLQQTLTRDLRIGHVDVMRLPMAQDIQMPKKVDFGRVAIGYGLSFHPANLNKIWLPSELSALEPPRRHWIHPQYLSPGDPGFSWTINGTD